MSPPLRARLAGPAGAADGAGGLVARLAALLPPGTLWVGAGLGVLGAGSYAQLGIAGHSLATSGMADMSVLWTVVFWTGLGVSLPVEQELIRLVAARKARGEGIIPVARRGAVLAAAVHAVALLPLVVAARPVAERLFGGSEQMTAALGASLAALAVTSVSRGLLAGMGRFGVYGAQIAADGGLRIILAVGLGAAGVHSATAFGLTVAVAPLVSVVCTLRPLIRDLRPGPPAGWRLMCRGVGLLIGTMLLAQLVVNAAVINVRLLSPGDPAAVGALFAAMVLVRVPLFMFTSLQVSLLPGLARAIASGERARFRQLLVRSCGIVAVLGTVFGVPGTVLGPWLVRVLFAARPVLGDADFAVLAVATLCYMLALVLGQAAMALSRHRDLLLCWLAGAVVLIGVTLGPGPVRLRVEAGYALGSLAVAAALAAVLQHQRRAGRAWRGTAPAAG